MHRHLIALLLSIPLAPLMTGCSNEEEIIDTGISDSKILQGKVLEEETNGLWIEPVNELEKWGDKVRVGFSDVQMTADVNEGQIINIWYDNIRESDPPQIHALKIEVED
ncbi:DUF3221 domain-containing protein [Bacillus salacetis]|uniref:DUF3221 domain-containing protein n=1 Tax=Bacillus salacetis TaxID=2315464 RepID=A0A3A1QU19_9BACI|nr:DUF3221 domain-containing protein [Bacillus salacetis]RIW30375.1 DUF3221 domain-containing protein [Bacillus salacetis]